MLYELFIVFPCEFTWQYVAKVGCRQANHPDSEFGSQSSIGAPVLEVQEGPQHGAPLGQSEHLQEPGHLASSVDLMGHRWLKCHASVMPHGIGPWMSMVIPFWF